MRTSFRINLLSAGLLAAVAACDNSEGRYDTGYDDGYAAGYNTTCEIRATLVEGDWGDKDYSAGYREGYAAGSLACQKDRD